MEQEPNLQQNSRSCRRFRKSHRSKSWADTLQGSWQDPRTNSIRGHGEAARCGNWRFCHRSGLPQSESDLPFWWCPDFIRNPSSWTSLDQMKNKMENPKMGLGSERVSRKREKNSTVTGEFAPAVGD